MDFEEVKLRTRRSSNRVSAIHKDIENRLQWPELMTNSNQRERCNRPTQRPMLLLAKMGFKYLGVPDDCCTQWRGVTRENGGLINQRANLTSLDHSLKLKARECEQGNFNDLNIGKWCVVWRNSPTLNSKRPRLELSFDKEKPPAVSCRGSFCISDDSRREAATIRRCGERGGCRAACRDP